MPIKLVTGKRREPFCLHPKQLVSQLKMFSCDCIPKYTNIKVCFCYPSFSLHKTMPLMTEASKRELPLMARL